MGNARGFALKVCADCKTEYRRLYKTKGKYLCWNCSRKLLHLIGDFNGKRMSLEKALDRVYEVNGYLNSSGYVQAGLSTPSILIGHKVKLVLVGGEKK